jgi:hypothetical protein
LRTSPFTTAAAATGRAAGQATSSWLTTSAAAAAAAAAADYNNGDGCIRYCDNAYDPAFGKLAGPNMTSSRECCDGVWLPTFSLRNAVALPAGRVEPLYTIAVAADNQTVTWRQSVHGIFFTPMDFRAFPFDKQVGQQQLGALLQSAPPAGTLCLQCTKPQQHAYMQIVRLVHTVWPLASAPTPR